MQKTKIKHTKINENNTVYDSNDIIIIVMKTEYFI